MYPLVFLLHVALFYVLTPGIFLSLPKGGSKKIVALTHAIVFAIVSCIIMRLFLGTLQKFAYKVPFIEGMDTMPKDPKKTMPASGGTTTMPTMPTSVTDMMSMGKK